MLCCRRLSSLVLRNRIPAAFYHKKVIEYYDNTKNVGTLNSKDPNVGTGLVGAPACGDVMRLQIRVGDDGKIQEAKFKTFGCGSAIASSSYATSWLEGKDVDQAMKLKNTDISSHLSLPPVKLHCSMLAEDAVKTAITDWRKKQAERKKKQQTPPAAASSSPSDAKKSA
eukprot:TRINITY_DN3305_c0_g1_i1.p1 TRINITY_DN3305_c0_g1~~TRINITY_DN3305_c0_g1_i1.p1  ORF type:complete len:193 (+),score=56.01 TRINITY_DN3305_c0_g1_i1:73-579(+)